MTDALLTLEKLTGADPRFQQYLPDLARLRITVFRDFPYLYDGSLAYEERYLKNYTTCPENLILLALDGETVVGASTGIPLEHESQDIQNAFREQGYDPHTIFYCGESVLLKEYRGRGIYKEFFKGREDHARSLGRFTHSAFCCVQRPATHPRRPADYVPLDAIWSKFGYVPDADLRTQFSWKDLDETGESAKDMMFWLKAI